MESHFDDLKEKLIKEIQSAEFFIYGAVAWITEGEIIRELTKKLYEGIRVELILNDDQTFNSKVHKFTQFLKAGGKIYLFKNVDGALMHNKFCVIDFSTVVTGSFNWTHSASTKHKENIIIGRDNIIESRKFCREFKSIKKDSIIYRLEKKFNNDASNFANVTGKFFSGGDDGEYICQVNIQLGKKNGVLLLELDNPNQIDDIPDKIFGFWEGLMFENKINGDFYNFNCLDPNILRFMKKP